MRSDAAVAATGAVLLVTASAQAQKPEKVGNGIPTGQLGVQLFNYGGFINNGGGLGDVPPAMGVSPACATSTTTECRWERLERLFAYLQSKGVTNVELFGHSNFPANGGTANLLRYRALLPVRPARGRLARRYERGQLGRADRRSEDSRRRLPRLRRLPAPGINSCGDTLLTAQALNRLGKKSIQAGLGPVYFHNHQTEFTNKYIDDGVERRRSTSSWSAPTRAT